MLTEIQQQGIIEHDLNRTRLVKLVNENYERIKQERFRKAQEGQAGKIRQQAPKN